MKCAILISLYNAEKTLDRTFESLRTQSFQDFRIVAINDASQDNTRELLLKWKGLFGYERFIILENTENLGLTQSLNRGLSVISEPFTARIDADDWWYPQKLEKQVTFLESHPDHGLVGCNYVNRKNKNDTLIKCPETDAAIKKDIIRRNPFAHSCVVFRTDIIKQAGDYDVNIRFGQDYELWLRIATETKFHNLQECLCVRNAENGISSDKQDEQMIQCIKTQIRYIRKLHRSPLEYRYLIEPLAVIALPTFIRNLKRKYL